MVEKLVFRLYSIAILNHFYAFIQTHKYRNYPRRCFKKLCCVHKRMRKDPISVKFEFECSFSLCSQPKVPIKSNHQLIHEWQKIV